MYRNYYLNHDYFGSESFDNVRDAMRDARRVGFETAIYKTDAENVYKDTNKVLVASYSVISGTKIYDAAHKTACLYQGEMFCVNSSPNHIC